MKFNINKWTLGLAAVGAVSMASAVRADEAKLSQVQTALSNTIISGYVSASANWEATMMAPQTKANSLQMAQAAIPAQEAIALSAARPVTQRFSESLQRQT